MNSKGKAMFLVSNRLPVNPDYAEQFEERFAEREARVDKMDGFISFHILRPQKEGLPYVVQTTWESEAHFKAWTESDAFRAQHGQQRTLPEDALLGRPEIEYHEIIQKSEKSS
ncbi:MAG: antibiotic biosynthesis monooxygenase [Bacteroidota bacterium]